MLSQQMLQCGHLLKLGAQVCLGCCPACSIAADSIGGFTEVVFKAAGAIDAMFSVGAQTGYEKVFRCPPNTVVTGMAGGGSPVYHLYSSEPGSWISHLQFQCRWEACQQCLIAASSILHHQLLEAPSHIACTI